MRKQSIIYKTLCRALSLKRPADGTGAQLLSAWLCDNIPGHLALTIDTLGNIHVDARTSTHHRTLFVAHVDTVHYQDGPNKFRKTKAKWYASGAPLGADDGAGCAMLMHLLHAGVPGYYIFTQAEECGGIGAKHLADAHKDLLKQFDRAIAFDRRGIDSVITHQGYGRCCSDVFADALSAALNADDTLMYLPDSTGVYTDTAEFTDIIPECTNISVGYDREHSEHESLDIYHFTALAERVVKIAWDNLPTDRDPAVRESKWDAWDATSHRSWASSTSVSPYLSGFSSYANDSDDAFYDYYEDEDEETLVHEALQDSLMGYTGELIILMCESVYPEDPDLARRFIDKTKLNDETLLKQAIGWNTTLGAPTALAALFDAVYREHA
jgi:hypothetical protein